jgi:creatinine amidohydrolase
MINSMFQDTMVNMKWTEIQECVEKNALVLLPLGVIEEHGPQLCLGTDIYTAHIHCVFIKLRLEEKGLNVVIAPPFYWGVCQSTGGFMGSFRVRKETARALLVDILTSLAGFGFKNIFGVSGHGDIEHNVAILEAFKEAGELFASEHIASEKRPINARFAFSQSLIPHYGLSGGESFLCPVMPQAIRVSQAKAPDVHGGDIETATIHHFYPQLVDGETARSLPPVEVGDDKIWTWLLGGHTQELSANGYVGSPANFERVDVIGNIQDIAERISVAILEKMG